MILRFAFRVRGGKRFGGVLLKVADHLWLGGPRRTALWSSFVFRNGGEKRREKK